MEFTDSEIAAAKTQMEARIAMIRKRATYYQGCQDEIDKEAMLTQILLANRRGRPSSSSGKRLGETRQTSSISLMEKANAKEDLESWKREKEEAERKKEESLKRGLQKEGICGSFHLIQTALATVSEQSNIEESLAKIVEKIHLYIAEVQESTLDEMDKFAYLQRLGTLDITHLEKWMHSLKYDVLQRTGDIERIRQQIEVFSEITGIPISFEVEMHTEDDEAFCRQLIADDLAQGIRYDLSGGIPFFYR
jgi:hypothetical protein